MWVEWESHYPKKPRIVSFLWSPDSKRGGIENGIKSEIKGTAIESQWEKSFYFLSCLLFILNLFLLLRFGQKLKCKKFYLLLFSFYDLLLALTFVTSIREGKWGKRRVVVVVVGD